MFHLLMVACLLVTGTASVDLEAADTASVDLELEGTASDLEAEESVPPIQVYNLDEVHHQDEHQKQRPHDVYLQSVRGYKGQSKVDRIVTELNNPDYIEPITVLDYRYVKTGGRDYTRGAGGQILILPKNVRTNQKKEFNNYDELLEFLRLKQIAEIEAHHKEMAHLAYENRQHNEHHIDIGRHQQEYHDYRQHHQQQRGYPYGLKRDASDVPKPSTAEVVA